MECTKISGKVEIEKSELNGSSLNSSMLAGPKLQKQLAEILLKFRQKPIPLG